MGIKKEKQLLLIIIVLIILCLLVFARSETPPVKKNIKLPEFLTNIDGYRKTSTSQLDENVYKFLDLDDYLYITFIKENVPVSIYIGYYYTLDKVSAAHSPEVCFPGQGWILSETEYNNHILGNSIIKYAQVDATLGDQKLLVIYWYQSYHDTTPYVFKNKVYTFYNKIFNNDQQNAFVRISVPINLVSKERAEDAAIDFINSFYPEFVRFINFENKEK